MKVKDMTRQESMEVISSGHLAHLACCKGDRPYVVPIYYALDGNCLYSFSIPGKKIEWLRDNPHACILVERFRDAQSWKSVVISGHYQELPDTGQWHQERIHAWSLLERHANWWEPGGLKPVSQPAQSYHAHVFYRIDIEDITGRAATPGEPWGREARQLQD
ncbi:pyridoxamine 5'-phosphate oxidase family protein [Rhizobium sp. P32RR-XVIII]|uniref:pyridoxamine 5'-phosphate oxidase family protein n=1 Tax=Rhizobium sp. P32RR-XVIII TaxID=2726738 RepID=UPI0014565E66|nr:pyridoxamine 5'-phosphate oxidase family protein [Rhizobium sp. P32RR-XVIII]NLS08300.1 pyridoxamine 5'-phosphate oxidase family protein [Rhizobium sp. P32RR-XVIII]